MKKGNFAMMKSLLKMVMPLWSWMIAAVILGVFGFFCSILITVSGAVGVVWVLSDDPWFSWSVYFSLLAVMGISRGLFRYGEQAANHYIAFRVLALIRDKVFTALRRLCPSKLEGKGKGDLISMLTADVELLEVFFAHTISPVLIALIMSILLTAMQAMIHPVLGLYALFSYLLIGVMLPLYSSKRCDTLGREVRSQAGSFSSFLMESLRGLDEIIQYDQGERRLSQLQEQSSRLSAFEGRLRIRAGENMAMTTTAILVLSLGMLLLCTGLYALGQLDRFSLLISFVLQLSSFGAVSALSNLGVTLQNTLASGSRIMALLEEEEAVAEKKTGHQVSGGSAEFKDVGFAYDQELILNDFSLSVPGNKMLGIYGASGSGKSTLLKLLMRFWDVQRGSVKIGDHDIRDIQTFSLRGHESYMTQEAHLFHDTIEENIRFVRADADHDAVVDACRRANIHDYIMSLPEGYQTMVSELGNSLSGGEAQRINLARVFLHDAPLVLLDEPTSNLDSLNEAMILKALDEQKQDKTVIMVSHRLSTLRLCESILKMETGRNS